MSNISTYLTNVTDLQIFWQSKQYKTTTDQQILRITSTKTTLPNYLDDHKSEGSFLQVGRNIRIS